MERPASMLTIDEVVTTYGPVRALNGVSFEVPDSTITAVLGANGAGKTTLLRTINGLVRSRSGRIVYNDHGRSRLPSPYRRARPDPPPGEARQAERALQGRDRALLLLPAPGRHHRRAAR